jgi:toxin CcdB
VPYLLDVQSDLLEVFDVRVVVPLFRASGFARPIRRLNPRFRIEGVAVNMVTQFIAGTSVRNLGEVWPRSPIDAMTSWAPSTC